MQAREDKTQPKAKTYFYPNLYYMLGAYALIAVIVVVLFPVEASWESVLGVGVVSLSMLVVSLVAGPIGNTKTIEHTWLKDAAASSFITAFSLLTVGSIAAILGLIEWQLVNYAVIAVTTVDFIGKLILAKKRDT